VEVFNFFGRKTRQSTAPPVLYFKSGRAFWEYQCQFGNTAIEKNVAVVALVVDAQKELGTPTPISIALGTIRAKVKPEIRVADPSLVIACRYD
jgi:hypothetical protein